MSFEIVNSIEKVQKYKDLEGKYQKILNKALQSCIYSYSPYSNFKVGCGLLCDDETIYGGCNIENISFTVGICAERTTYAKAISEGRTKFDAIAIIGYQGNTFAFPCGACRQFMSEFGDVQILIGKPDLEDVFITNLSELLPHQFNSKF